MEQVTSVIPSHRCASFRKRLYAYGYDSTIVGIMVAFVLWFIGGEAHAAYDQQQIDSFIQMGLVPAGTTPETIMAVLWSQLFAIVNWVTIGVLVVVTSLYNIFFLTGVWQATPGKRFCGIYVVNRDGNRLTLAESALRHFTCAISTFALALPYLMVCFTRDKVAPHDLICGTRVVLGKTDT